MGDAFLHNNWDTVLSWKSGADKMFMLKYFKAISCHPGIHSNIDSVIACIFNEFIHHMNKKSQSSEFKLPRYIVILPDKDILADINFNNFGIERIVDDAIHWLSRNVHRSIQLRREDMQLKNPGSVGSSSLPKVIWVNMLVWPFLKKVEKPFILSQCGKFNTCIERMVDKFPNYHSMKIWMPVEINLYDQYTGVLSEVGKAAFWKEVNKVLAEFDKALRNKMEFLDRKAHQNDHPQRIHPVQHQHCPHYKESSHRYF